MTTVSTAFRLRIHDAGTSTPGDGTVDFTLTDLADVPQFGGSVVEPTRGSSAMGQWSFEVVDTAGVITANLSDPATGRADLIGRLAEIQEDRSAGGWATVSVGRLTALSVQSGAQASYLIDISDERWVERNSRVFVGADTAYLWPAGLRHDWRGIKGGGFNPYTIFIADNSGDRFRILAYSYYPLPGQIQEWIRRDLVDEPVVDRSDGEGNFQHLVARIDDVDYPVLSFGIDIASDSFLETLDQPDTGALNRSVLSFWVHAPGGFPSGIKTLRLWAPTAPAAPALPLHLGTTSGSHRFGTTNPFELVETLYDEAGVRYDPTALAALQAKEYPPMSWRITDGDLTVATFVEEQIYAPLGVVPFVDDSGRVSPRSVRLPSAEDFDPSTAFELNVGNCATAPSFDHQATGVVNVITVQGRGYRAGNSAGRGEFFPRLTDFVADYLEEIEYTIGPRSLGGGTAALGPRPKTFKAYGLPSEAFGAVEWLFSETFDRFGDGPVWGTVTALRTPQDGSGRTPEDLKPGDLVVLNVPTWPNMATQARGGARIVQIMSVRPGPIGIEFDFLDVGPNLQPLLAPTVSVALSGTTPRHAVVLTIGSIPAGARVQARVGIGAGTDYHRTYDDLASGAVVGGLPSGTLIRVQVRAVAPGRVRSLWSSVDSVTTTALSAPTSLSATVVGRAVKLTWTPAVTGYPLMPVFRTAGGGAWTNALANPLPPGSTVYTFPPQAASTSYDWGVRHVDQFGGLGTVAFATLSTSTARKLAAPLRPQVLQGRATGGLEDLPPEELRIGYGIHVGFLPSEPSASTVAQVSTDSGFASIDQEVAVTPGATSVFVFTGALDETVRYVRLLHRRDGNDDSDPSGAVSSKPTALLDTPGNDAFPGGFAEVFERDGGLLEIFIQAGGDVNTDGASYEWAKNPSPEEYPTVDDTSRAVGPLPVRENLNADDGEPPTEETFATGDVVMIRVRFSNSETGFGQEFLIRHVYGQATVVVTLDRLELYNPTSGPFPLAVLRMRAFLRAPGAVASVRSTLTITPWNGTSYDAQAVRSADVDVSPSSGILELICPTTGGGPNTFKLKDQVDSWDLDFYDAVGGAGGAGNVIASFRVIAGVLAGEAGAGQMQLYSTAGDGEKVSADGIRFGSDGKGDGVFETLDGGIVKQRDLHDAGSISSSWQPDYADGPAQKASMSGDTQLLVPDNWATARPMNLRIATNGHALTFQSTRFYADGGSLPTLSGVVFLSLVLMDTNYVVIAALANLGAV